MLLDTLLKPPAAGGGGGAFGLERQNSGMSSFYQAFVRRQSTASGELGPCRLGSDTSSTTTAADMDEDCQTSRRISLAKVVLAEATISYTASCTSPQALAKSSCRNSGALGPLVAMLQECRDVDRLRVALETLAFLTLDKSNRRIAHELHAVDAVLDIMRCIDDQQVLQQALDVLSALCRYDAKDKVALWQHPNKGALLSMMNTRHSPTLIIESLRTCRQLCFSGPGSSKLLEPALLTVASELLHPHMDLQVLLKALKLLNAAAAVPDTEHLHAPGWHNVVFRIVPLLSASQTAGSAEVLDSALDVLVSLSEHAHFGNMFYASGCIAPLLALLGSANCGLAQSASCILSALAEGGLSRDKLCQDTALLPMMRALKANHCVVVTIGVLYMLGRLAAYRTQVVNSLRSWGAVPLLLKLLQTVSDEDAILGTLQVLETLGVHHSPTSSSGSQRGSHHCHGHGAVAATDGSGSGGCGGMPASASRPPSMVPASGAAGFKVCAN